MEKQSAIYPGKPWLDTEGKRIQAHGGSVMYLDGTYYWYGENKEKTDGKSEIWHWGVRCYSSKDLYNWKDEGIIIAPEPDDPNSLLHPNAYMDRPHIIYNRKTNKYATMYEDFFLGKVGHVDDPREYNTSVSEYVWLPLRFEGDMVYIDWKDEGRIEDYE